MCISIGRYKYNYKRYIIFIVVLQIHKSCILLSSIPNMQSCIEEKIFEKVYDVRRTTDDDDGRQVMAIAHMTLWVR
jgi:hypothetical protein